MKHSPDGLLATIIGSSRGALDDFVRWCGQTELRSTKEVVDPRGTEPDMAAGMSALRRVLHLLGLLEISKGKMPSVRLTGTSPRY